MNNENIEILAKNLNISVTKQLNEKFENFSQLFKIYNSHTNLISKNDEKHLFEKHIYDSLALNLFLEKYHQNENSTILDIGTGGGFPSIPLAIYYKDLSITPLDSIAKKIGFIELIQKELRLENLTPICKRVEELATTYKSSFDIVTSRAVASLNTLLEYTIPYVKVGGYFVAYKSKNADEEIANAQNAFETLNAKLIDRIEYKLPLNEYHFRELLIIKKIAPTPKAYPRKSGQAKKNPL